MIKVPTHTMRAWRSDQKRFDRMIRKTIKAIEESRELLKQTSELVQQSEALSRSRIRLLN